MVYGACPTRWEKGHHRSHSDRGDLASVPRRAAGVSAHRNPQKLDFVNSIPENISTQWRYLCSSYLQFLERQSSPCQVSDAVSPRCQVEVLANTAVRVKLDTHRLSPKLRERKRNYRLPSLCSLPLASVAISCTQEPLALENILTRV